MLIDVHSHTTLSDGTLSVEAMVAAAERRGYDLYAVTDHVTPSMDLPSRWEGAGTECPPISRYAYSSESLS